MGREEMLKNVPIFSELGRRDLERLSKLMVPRAVKAGEVIIKEGDQAAGFFVINTGKVEVVRGADGSSPQVLNTLGPGDFFGEMALFEGFPRNATVRAVDDSECLAMTRWDFMAEMKNHPEIAVSMLPVLVRRLRNVEAHVNE
ncbi:MAG TPA: cyclic nucleotide-binding domain-containing protein [Dehalococcoidia bacterium]|nr:cyclic nucleotide-binding domain-containing protein [Dehalococcoidia bacterium]